MGKFSTMAGLSSKKSSDKPRSESVKLETIVAIARAWDGESFQDVADSINRQFDCKKSVADIAKRLDAAGEDVRYAPLVDDLTFTMAGVRTDSKSDKAAKQAIAVAKIEREAQETKALRDANRAAAELDAAHKALADAAQALADYPKDGKKSGREVLADKLAELQAQFTDEVLAEMATAAKVLGERYQTILAAK